MFDGDVQVAMNERSNRMFVRQSSVRDFFRKHNHEVSFDGSICNCSKRQRPWAQIWIAGECVNYVNQLHMSDLDAKYDTDMFSLFWDTVHREAVRVLVETLYDPSHQTVKPAVTTRRNLLSDFEESDRQSPQQFNYNQQRQSFYHNQQQQQHPPQQHPQFIDNDDGYGEELYYNDYEDAIDELKNYNITDNSVIITEAVQSSIMYDTNIAHIVNKLTVLMNN